MTAFVTGAGGFVGAALVRELLTRGHEVRAGVHSNPRALDGLELDQRFIDVEELQNAAKVTDNLTSPWG